jgi:hypothetical protein
MRLLEANHLTTSLRHIDGSETQIDAVQVFLQDKNDEGERTWALLASILIMFFDTRKVRTSEPVAASLHFIGARGRQSTRQTRGACSLHTDACLLGLFTPDGNRASKGIGPTKSDGSLVGSTSPAATSNGAAANMELNPKDAKHMNSKTRMMESPTGGVMSAGVTRQGHEPQVATRLGVPESQQSSPSLFLSHMANITPSEQASDPSNSSDASTRRHSEPAEWSACTSSMHSVQPLAPSPNPQLMHVVHSNVSQCGGRHKL